MEFLVSDEVRKNAGVSDNNNYIFANTMNSTKYAMGWHCINEMLVKIDKKGALNATKNRHRVASLLARFNLSDRERELVFNHFGHSKEVNQAVYQAAAGSEQVNSTAKMLLKVRFSFLSKFFTSIRYFQVNKNTFLRFHFSNNLF